MTGRFTAPLDRDALDLAAAGTVVLAEEQRAVAVVLVGVPLLLGRGGAVGPDIESELGFALANASICPRAGVTGSGRGSPASPLSYPVPRRLMAALFDHPWWLLTLAVIGIIAIFAFTACMGAALGPMLNSYLALPGGPALVFQALGATAVVFLGLSGYVLTTKKDFSFMRGFLAAGMIVMLVGVVVALFTNMPAFELALSGGKSETVTVDRVILAIGITGNVEDLGLEGALLHSHGSTCTTTW